MHHRLDRENGKRNPIYIKYGTLIMILLLKMASESNNNRSGILSKGFFMENVWIFTKNLSKNQEHRQHKAAIIFSLEGKCL